MTLVLRLVHILIWATVLTGAVVLFPISQQTIQVVLVLLMLVAARELFVASVR